MLLQVSGTVDRILRERAEDVIDMQRAVSNVKRQVAKEADAEPDSKKGGKKKGGKQFKSKGKITKHSSKAAVKGKKKVGRAR